MTARDGHAMQPEEFRRRAEALVPDGHPSAARYLAELTTTGYSTWIGYFTGHNRVTEHAVRLLALLEQNHRLRDGVARHQGPIESRIRRFRDDVRRVRRDLLRDLAPALRRLEELEDMLTRALGDT